MKKCASCGEPFDGDEEWMRLCWDCYKSGKAAPMQRKCAVCGDSFTAKGTWQKLCAGCYSVQKRRELVAPIEAERDDALLQLTAVRLELSAAKARCERLERALAEKNIELRTIATKPTLPHDQWRRLVQLCHPDRRGGSEAANGATRWLLENRP